MYRLIWLVVILAAVGQLGGAGDAPVGATPVPPPVTSEIGYLRVEADVVSLAPAVPRVFIVPRSRLPLLEESARELILLAERRDGAVACRIPKTTKGLVSLIFEPELGTVQFRGAVEAVTVPFALRQGEELAVRRAARAGGEWLAVLVRDNREISLSVPESLAGVVFSHESRFAEYAARQAERGLVWCAGEWLPEAEARSRQAAANAARERRERVMTAMREAAEQGALVLSDGRVLRGRLSGSSADRILFEAEGNEFWLSPEDIADLPAAEMCARGAVAEGERMLTRAEQLRESDVGRSAYLAGEIRNVLKRLPNSAAPATAAAAADLGRRAELLETDIQARLAAEGKVLYRFTALPREEVDWHLHQGHLLFRRQFWLRPDQVCARCQGSGRLGCPECNAVGKIRQPCLVCQGTGQLECPVCEGDGHRPCTRCGGDGLLSRLCRRCHGRGSIYEYTYQFPMWNCDPQVVIGGGGSPYYVIPGRRYSSGYPVSVDCPRCGGDGREQFNCPVCHGHGAVACPKTVACQTCAGTGFTWGTCPKCHGRREVPCPDCLARGFLGEPQRLPPPEEPVMAPETSPDPLPIAPPPPAVD